MCNGNGSLKVDELPSAFSKLLDDHHALADAVHGILGRVQLLEARVDYLEHGRQAARELIKKMGGNNSDLSNAIDTGLYHCGRAIFIVEGETGLWCGKRDYGDDNSKGILVALPPKRGNVRSRFLYRQDALSETVPTILGKCVGKVNPEEVEA